MYGWLMALSKESLSTSFLTFVKYVKSMLSRLISMGDFLFQRWFIAVQNISGNVFGFVWPPKCFGWLLLFGYIVMFVR